MSLATKYKSISLILICWLSITSVSAKALPGIQSVTNVTVPASSSTGDYTISWSGGDNFVKNIYEQKDGGSYVFIIGVDGGGSSTFGASSFNASTFASGSQYSYNIYNRTDGVYRYRILTCETTALPNCSPYAYSNNITVALTLGGPNTPPAVPDTLPSHDATAGALAGQFKVDESGQVNYNINIATVAGKGGVAPQVSLSYSSQSGNGIMGVGWNISGQSAITRCRRTWEQDLRNAAVDLTANDRFCLNGQRLVLVSGIYGSANSVYKTEIDTQVEVTAYSGSAGNPNYFKVTAKDGSISEYGVSSDSKLYSNAPGQTTKITTWAQNKFTDNTALGNNYTYTYTTNSTTQEFLLSSINYTGTGSNAINFIYEPRTDTSIGWSATGARFESNNRLARVDSYASGQVVRSYHLSYEMDTFSLLNTLEECVDINATTCLQPTTFDWEKLRNGFQASPAAQTYTNPGFTQDVKLQPIDINGDGLQDVAYNSGGTIRVGVSAGTQLNYYTAKTMDVEYHGFWEQLDYNGDGRTDLMYIKRQGGLYTWTISLSNGINFSGGDISTGILVENGDEAGRMRVMDVNGDAMPDLVYQKVYSGLFYARYMERDIYGTRSFGAENPLLFGAVPAGLGVPTGSTVSNIQLKDIQVMDVNGDGIVDVFGKATINGIARYTLFAGEHQQNGDLTAYRYVPYYLLSITSGMPSELKHYKILDVNGDGLADIMYRNTNSSWYLLLNKGQGEFGGTNNTTPIWLGSINLDDYIQFADYNQDGKPDLIYIDNANNLYVRPWTGVTFGSAVSLGLPSWDRNVSSRVFMDVNGDGLTDYL